MKSAIESWIRNYASEIIIVSDKPPYYVLKAKKYYRGNPYDLFIRYDVDSSMIYVEVFNIVSSEKRKVENILNILNEQNLIEDRFKFALYPVDQTIVGNLILSSRNFYNLLGNSIEGDIDYMLKFIQEIVSFGDNLDNDDKQRDLRETRHEMAPPIPEKIGNKYGDVIYLKDYLIII